MAKPKNLETWGRSKARQRYAEGGETPMAEDAMKDPEGIDDFISAVMKEHMDKLTEND